MKVSSILGVSLAATVAAQTCLAPAAKFTPRMADGYTAKLIVSGLRSPRGLIFDTQGHLLVVEQGKGLTQVTVSQQSDGSVCAVSTKSLIASSALNHGIEFAPGGKTLLVSSADKVFAYNYDAATGNATNQKTLVTGMSNSGHSTRTLLLSPSNPDLLLVSRGSGGNIDNTAANINSGSSAIKYFSLSKILSTPANYATEGTLLGWGLRNSVGVAEHPITGGIWSVENSMDDIKRQGVDVHMDNPAEEMNYHGVLNATNPLQGANYGYPSCVAAWNASTLGNPNLKMGQQFVPNTAQGVDVAATDSGCGKFQAPRVVFPSHTAPLDIKFTKDGSSAFVSFHGSWDRNPPDGYRVVRIDFGSDGQPTTTPAAGTTIMANPDNTKCPSGCFRPAGLVLDSAGRLYMSSDSTGEIYVITRK